MPRTAKKNKRQSLGYEIIELRLRPAQLRRVKRAAEIKGISVSDFVDITVSIAHSAAIKIIEAAEATS